jgi:PPM family protein phosphatase
MMQLRRYAAQTHQGPYLELNEDDISVDLNNQLYMILDGFGGNEIGIKAVQLLKDTINQFYTKIGGDPEATLPFFYSYKYLIEGNALINAMYYAHELMKKENLNKEMSSRGGASALAVSSSENILTFASVGNCKSLLFRKGELVEFIVPESLNFLAKDNFESHFQSSPTNAFGLFDDFHYQVKEVRISPYDVFILMTDGVYSRLNADEIKHIINKKDFSNQERIQELFKLSNMRGNLDNQSMIILEY